MAIKVKSIRARTERRRHGGILAFELTCAEQLADNTPKRETRKGTSGRLTLPRELIEGWMGAEVLSFCYPFYDAMEAFKEPVIAAGYRQARSGKRNSFYAEPDSVDYFGVDCRQIAQTGEEAANWVRSGCWHVLTFHGIGTEEEEWEPVAEREFSTLMEELARFRDIGKLDVVTFNEGAERLRRAQG